MGKLYQIINLPRSIPLFLCYSKLPCVDDIRQDLIRRGYSGSLWNLHQAFVGDKLYRNIFYCRSHKYAPILTKILKRFYRLQAQFGIKIGNNAVIGAGNRGDEGCPGKCDGGGCPCAHP